MRGFTDEEIEGQTRLARQVAGIDNQLQPDLMTVITAYKRAGSRPFNYQRCGYDDLPEAEAAWDASKSILMMRHDVFGRMNSNEPRARFTISHELGHFWLKHSGIRNRSITPSIAERLVSQIRREEREAMRFAPAFLAPAHLIDPFASIEEIMETFLLSKEAATIRSQELQRLYRRKNRIERPLPASIEEFIRTTKW
ncbi:ImmA/IrrE family metallo-endopeptidase [Hansschlegelia sp.]|uniref:ImmA/IrrE family metallo-endopeptidase n=1 Tax=Hansschlegelia sp. TaxID=2041892 RepID=UPI002B9A62D5|nr:ImmA/IrrE family metallo-endopeptidase [Hansschlegelia sp.]HVI27442.1 ImmA/IrrE family metallo-endopeptidase [Hansschlegelia sp.]